MSNFAWIDHSEKQRRQILEAIDLFREKDTRDELGISVIRDAFADLLFPGTGSLQTRARYFFFIPWMYRLMEDRGVSAAGIGKGVRDFEIKLIDTLADSADTDGTIGIYARASLQRVPSSIYWSGLKRIRVCLFEGSQWEYHRAFDRVTATRKGVLRNDDGEAVGRGSTPVWSSVPPAPVDFPAAAGFQLTLEEANYLREKVLESKLDSLFAFLLQRPHDPSSSDFVWDNPSVATASPGLKRQIDHARNFSEVMFGASILYNLNLAEIEPVREEVRENCLVLLSEWRSMMDARGQQHRAWDRLDFWRLVTEAGGTPSAPTRWFVEAWIDMALGDLSAISDSGKARELLIARERNIKGPLARCDNARSREVWRGESGLSRLEYRWRNAAVILHDVFTGLGELHA